MNIFDIYIYIHIYRYETCARTPNNCFLSKTVVEISVVQIQVETERGVYYWQLGLGTYALVPRLTPSNPQLVTLTGCPGRPPVKNAF